MRLMSKPGDLAVIDLYDHRTYVFFHKAYESYARVTGLTINYDLPRDAHGNRQYSVRTARRYMVGYNKYCIIPLPTK